MKTIFRSLLFLFLLKTTFLFSQKVAVPNADSVEWQSVIDKPESIRRFFLGLQPLYADVFANGINAGYGVDALYLPKSGKYDVRASFRKPYSSRSADFVKDKMTRYSNTLNDPVGFMYFEMSGSVTIKDQVKNSPVKIAVIRKSEKPSSLNWVESVPVPMPSKIRVMQSVRVGFQSWRSALDVTSTLEKQGSRNADVALPEQLIDEDGNVSPFYVFSNLYNRTIFAGFGLTQIRNRSLLIDGYETALQDKMVTFYGDLMYARNLSIDDAVYGLAEYSLEKVKLNKIGLRAGVEMRTNRKRGWGYAAETGWRPAPKGNTGYLLIKVSIPVFAGYLVARD